MIKTSRLLRNSVKLFQNNLRFANVQESKSVVNTDADQTSVQQEETPVHLRPYDKNKYEVPSSKLKVAILPFVL